MTMSVLPTPNLQLRRVCTNLLMIYRAELHCKLNRWLMIMICFVGKRAFTFIAPLGASETPTRKDNRALLWCNIQKLIKANKASPHKFYLRQLDLTSCQMLFPTVMIQCDNLLFFPLHPDISEDIDISCHQHYTTTNHLHHSTCAQYHYYDSYSSQQHHHLSATPQHLLHHHHDCLHRSLPSTPIFV